MTPVRSLPATQWKRSGPGPAAAIAANASLSCGCKRSRTVHFHRSLAQ